MTRAAWTPAQAERYLRSLELFGMRFGLDRMRRLMTVLDSPHERFESVHVVGTNGKSSTARMTAALLAGHGLRTGAYFSPHITSFAERIEIGGRALAGDQLARAVQRAAQASAIVDRALEGDDHVTQFEALTAAAYWELAERGVEAAVVEAGLGGRYDATSVVHPKVQVLTNVGLEHTRWLGPTVRHIAEEKLAAVPEGGTLVTGAIDGAALAVARQVARERAAELLVLGCDIAIRPERAGAFGIRTRRASYGGIALRARGEFQQLNFALAVAAAELFLGRALDLAQVRATARELRLRGRLEVVAERPRVVLDGAHNPPAAEALRAALPPVAEARRTVIVLSVLDDKDAAGILSVLLPLCDRAVFTKSRHERALPPATLESLCRQLGGPPAEVVAEPRRALARAREAAGPEGAVLVTGSIYLLADLAEEGAGADSEVA
jgi:dihydrofolate synthase/folylpolyglutamate synthase